MTSLILSDTEQIEAFSIPDDHEKSRPKEDNIIVDGHVDLPFYMMRQKEDQPLSALEDGPFTLGKMKEAGVRLFAGALYCQDKFNGEGSLGHLKEILGFTLDHFDGIMVVKKSPDLERIKTEPDGLGTLLLLENADALAGNPLFVDELMEAGLRVVGLTHMGPNRLGDGNAVHYSDGLTDEGREVVRVLTEQGLLIDVAHLHPGCFWQLLDLCEGPIISSHTGIRNLCDIQRNLDLEQAGEIFARDGMVGITFNPEMLSLEGRARVEDIFVHMDMLVQKFGPDHVGIGSDFCGFEGAAEEMEDITKVPNLTRLMLAHGYGQEAVGKIMGLNWLRLYESILSG